MGGYTEKDAAEETEAGGKETAEAWHSARDDAQTSDHPYDQSLTEGWERTPDSEREGDDE
jgi:hypothetical protein